MGFEPTFSGSEGQKPTVSAHPLSWFDVRKRFIEYLKSIEYSERTVKDLVSYLDRYVSVIREPYNVVSLFSKVKSGKRHLVLALRKLFKFYEVLGYDVGMLDNFRKALPKIECGIDVKIPMESKIIDSLKKLEKIPQKYHAIYDLLLDSGLRLTEAIQVINNFNEANLTAVNGFYRYELAMFRGSKQAFYGHFTEHTLKEILKVKEKLHERATSRYLGKHGFVRPKYLRKYAFDKMIELDVPESVADFIEGRVPQKTGAKHYMAMARQSSKFYPRYIKHIEKLRKA